MTYRDDATALPAPAFACEPADVASPLYEDAFLAEHDPRVFDYVVAAQGRFDGLRQCAAQMAGLLVLVASGGRADASHPMLALARETLGGAADATFSANVPAGARHHHHHMLAAARRLTAALAALPVALAKRDGEAIDKAFYPLAEGFRELQAASRALPGFEVVDFDQGCCAAHAGLRRSQRILQE